MYQQLFEPRMEAPTDDISNCTPHNQLANETATRENKKTGHRFPLLTDIMADSLSYRKHNRICCISLMSSHAPKHSSYRCVCSASSVATIPANRLSRITGTQPRLDVTMCTVQRTLFVVDARNFFLFDFIIIILFLIERQPF